MRLSQMTLEQAEEAYRRGVLTQDHWEGYAHAWRVSAPRFSSLMAGYEDHPEGFAGRVADELGCGCR